MKAVSVILFVCIILCYQHCESYIRINSQRRSALPRWASFGPNNFGDIMGGPSGIETYITLGESGDRFTALERIVLTANGNLQRIMSAYYGAPVVVDIIKCDLIKDMVYDREVNLVSNGYVFCKAIGVIELYNRECITAIEEKKIGVGQLFRYFDVLPSFKLLDVGKNEDGTLWRDYTLSCSHFTCRFTETFSKGFLEKIL